MIFKLVNSLYLISREVLKLGKTQMFLVPLEDRSNFKATKYPPWILTYFYIILDFLQGPKYPGYKLFYLYFEQQFSEKQSLNNKYNVKFESCL